MTPLDMLLQRLEGGAEIVRVAGLTGSSKATLLSQIYQKGGKRALVYLVPTGREAAHTLNDLQFFLGPLADEQLWFFPSYDVLPFTPLSPHNDISCERLKTLWRLRQQTSGIVVTTAAAALSRLPPPSLVENPVTLEKGEEHDRTTLLQQLTEWGYQQVPLVIDRGNVAVRGALIDIFSPRSRHPIRIEWMGDLIESIREFDPRTQKSLREVAQTLLIPTREVILNEKTVRSFSEKMRRRSEEADRPRTAWAPLIEKVRARIPFPGIETYLPLFFEETTTLWDWLPKKSTLVFEDPALLLKAAKGHLEEVALVQKEAPPIPSLSEIRMTPEEFQTALYRTPRIELSPLAAEGDVVFPVESLAGIRREIEQSRRSSDEPLSPLTKRLKDWLLTDQVILTASSQAQTVRLKELLEPHFPQQVEIPSLSFQELTPAPGKIQILIGEPSSGFRLPDEHLSLVTDEEIFGPKIRRLGKEVVSEALSSFAELKLGDPIVHKLHGIGIYRGLTHLTIEGTANDYLLIEYKGGDKLFLPVTRMNLVQRYTGADGQTPRIDRLGGTTWAKIKGKAEKAIREVAGELLNLYAARTAGPGFAFSPPNEIFETFEASFPYEETPDQERAIRETLADMQKPKPMDRLVLGDVGYGKTEVAIRAAFQAALDGKQTAVLVPTTLLAFQHFERFTERFRDYPVTIEMLSRFRSAAEQKAVVRDTAAGKVDILIGTHRIFQPDLSFKDLGLLVIDEEHRFGVGHKEKIKKLKKNVDVLALSATPIPRTLYMSLVGFRGISVIETPPNDRLSIRTFVMPISDAVIREAILREVKRGGQVFFVHNQVETIGSMKERLGRLVPEVTIEIGHGQMGEEELEEVMIRFSHQKFDLLLCTTIIESGIDIPTANTILIHHADRFGLAQIYQLRGRVGRGSHRAYAYLLIDEEKVLTAEATKRLSVLQRFSELGSGFKMASYDLEIRGAGNLLGEEQSGQMAAIGYELYTELLEEAVRELKGEEVLEEIDPELHFPIPSYLPEDYIPDPPVRLELYRRLASVSSEEEIDPIEDELRDRFGRPPETVENLLELSAIKALAKKLRIKQIRYDHRSFVYAFDPSSPLPPEVLTERIKKNPKVCRLTPDFRFLVSQTIREIPAILLETKRFLRELSLAC